MKIRLVSDLHVDYNRFLNDNIKFGFEDVLDETDVTLIAGDIAGHYSNEVKFLNRLKNQCKTNKIISIAGNHLGYNYRYNEPYKDCKETQVATLTYIFDENPLYLEDRSVQIDDYIIFGCVLFTDFNLYNSVNFSKNMASMYINDFRYVKTVDKTYLEPRTVTPEDYISWFNTSVDKIKYICENNPDKKIIILSHFAPSVKSIDCKYVDDNLNGFYASNLEDVIKKYDNLKLWCHGHCHDSFDYTINQCRVLCSPYGYFTREVNTPEPSCYFGITIDI